MHRFATEHFPHAVAVNDLGYVSYQNENYVLDLWGLGSEEARRRRKSGDFSEEDVLELAQKNDVRFAMVYESWIGEVIPKAWCRVATLETPRVSSGSDTVSVFLVDLEMENEIRAALATFATSLPEKSVLTLGDCLHETPET